MKKPQIKVSVETDLLDWLDGVAAERRCSLSQVAHEILLTAMRAWVAAHLQALDERQPALGGPVVSAEARP